MILLIDNYDSFVYNVAHALGELGQELRVLRNDAITQEEAAAMKPDYLVISPGPGRPEDGGISSALIQLFCTEIPVLGVCLGHQCIAGVFGGEIHSAQTLMHGKTSRIYHDGAGLFAGLPSPITATRYHSLAVAEESLPDCLQVSAHTIDGEIMGLRHKEYPVEGIQFHPESILTPRGKTIFANFLNLRRRQ